MSDAASEHLSDEQIEEALDDAVRQEPALMAVLDKAIEDGETHPKVAKTTGKGSGITPGRWGDMNYHEAALKSAQVRREKAAEKVRNAVLGKAVAQLKIKNAPSRDQLRETSAAVIFDLGHRILSGDLPVTNASTAAKVIDTFFNILRLESGQSTANVEHLSAEEKRKMIVEMQQAAQERKAALDMPK